jgi:hypothetical protein
MAGSGFGRRAAALTVPILLCWTAVVATPAYAAPPPNDSFAGRTVIPGLPYVEPKDTTEATTEPGEPYPRCGRMSKTVWYQFTPPSDIVLGAAAVDARFDVLLGVWTGPGLGSLTEVACSSYSPVVFWA